MGTTVSNSVFEQVDKKELLRPIIFCNPNEYLIESAVPVNVALAKTLITIKEDRRSFRMELCLKQLLDTMPANPVIKEFDVLFNPSYEIDVIKTLISVYKTKPFDVIWPGQYEEGKLIYAEEGYRDYKVYEISKYDITCVI